MPQLLGRDVVLNIGGLRIASRLSSGEDTPVLRVVFKAVRTLTSTPNTLELTIYNLSQDSMSAIQGKDQPTTLEVGYIDNTSIIFAGNLDFTESKLVATEWSSFLKVGDGTKKIKKSRVNLSLKGPVNIGDALKAAADALGVNVGNIGDAIKNGSLRGGLTQFVNGVTLSGKANKQMDRVVRSMGYTWSIQDGQLQLVEPGKALAGQAVVLSRENGLIGTPEFGEDGHVRVRSLIQTDLIPGRKIEVQSKQVNGFYKIEKTETHGDTWGREWYIDMEAKELK